MQGDSVNVSWTGIPDADEVIITREVNGNGTFHWRGRVAADSAFVDSNRTEVNLLYQVKARYGDGDSDWTTCS